MLTAVASLCVRNGRGASVPFARLPLLSTVKSSARSLNPNKQRHLSGPWLSRLLCPRPCGVQDRISARPLCLSADPRSPLPAPADGDPQEHVAFGTLSADMASKRSFRKSSPQTEDYRHQQWDEEEGEREKPRRKPFRRNSPYWYFLQCKKLIKENKVSRPAAALLLVFSLVSIR